MVTPPLAFVLHLYEHIYLCVCLCYNGWTISTGSFSCWFSMTRIIPYWILLCFICVNRLPGRPFMLSCYTMHFAQGDIRPGFLSCSACCPSPLPIVLPPSCSRRFF